MMKIHLYLGFYSLLFPNRSITQAIGQSEYFEIKVENGQIILTPVKIQRANAVRAKLAALELTEQDISDAVTWAR